jgi:hypothetical protein
MTSPYPFASLYHSRLFVGGLLSAALVFMIPVGAAKAVDPDSPCPGTMSCSCNGKTGVSTCLGGEGTSGECMAQLNTQPNPKGLNGVCTTNGVCFGSANNTGYLYVYSWPPSCAANAAAIGGLACPAARNCEKGISPVLQY